jgi:hypothetical protein
MAAFDFPESPTLGQTYTANGVTFVWTGDAWSSATAINAITVEITNDTTSTSTHYLYMGTGTSGPQATKVSNSKITFQPSTGNLVVAGDVTSNSDARLKTNITAIEGALAKVLAMRGVAFDMENSRRVGVIAQEVQKIIPEVVNTGESGYLAVSYGNLVGVLIEAVKELTAEVSELKARLGEK